MTRVKICGLTRIDDAVHAVAAGADAVGLNFWPRSSRFVSIEAARAIGDAVRGTTLLVGVFVDASDAEIEAARDGAGLDCVQLHGREPPEQVQRFLPHAYKALAVRDASSIAEAGRYPGEHVLLDAFVPGQPGGTGHTFRWELAADLARLRHVTLAGGLTPDNVAAAIAAVQPFCVDVASGVERAPGIKDAAAVTGFIRAAKSSGGSAGLQSNPGSPIGKRSTP
jgi:phosphoribosylanthranilate isomerase